MSARSAVLSTDASPRGRGVRAGCFGCAEDRLEHGLTLFSHQQVEKLPVVESDRRLVDRISRADVIAFYNREILRKEATPRLAE